MTDLNWFSRQWVYNTEIPSSKLEYSIQDQPDGSVMVSRNVLQEGVPETFFMPLPLVFTFGGERYANGTVHAYGPKTPFQIKLPNGRRRSSSTLTAGYYRTRPIRNRCVE